MRYSKIYTGAVTFIAILIPGIIFGVVPVQQKANNAFLNIPLEFDTQGRSTYSHHNFTNVKKDYNGIDSFLVLKPSLHIPDSWREASGFDFGKLGVYGQLTLNHTTEGRENEFFFQRNYEYELGAEWYPFWDIKNVNSKWLIPFRFYVAWLWKDYYDNYGLRTGSDGSLLTRDWRLGVDYYYDNLFDDLKIWLDTTIFMNFSYRDTNFSPIWPLGTKKYEGLLFSGDITIGHSFDPGFGRSWGLLYPHLLMEWSHSPRYTKARNGDEQYNRWFENYIRAGAGVSYYPFAQLYEPRNRNSNTLMFGHELLKRMNITFEWLHQVDNFGAQYPKSIPKDDVRLSISFSSGGYFGE